MRSVSIAIAASFVMVVVGATAHAGTPASGFTDTLKVGGLSAPTSIAFLPDARLLITEKTGALKLASGSTASTLATIPVCSGSEMGLLGIAIDPNFSSNGFIYLYRTKTGAGGCGTSTGRFNQVIRVTMTGSTVNLASLTVLLTGIRTDNGNHDGGGLRIGPDLKLYVGVGDTGLGDNQGGPGSSTNPYAQDLNSLNGKLLRLELNGMPAAGNPFIGQVGKRGEIYSYGLRNPFGFGFDPMSGKLWLGDVGDLTVEELDVMVSAGNYSWPYCEGTLPTGCKPPADIAPFFTYLHSGSGSLGTAVIGGAFANNSSLWGSMNGHYFFADYTANNVYRAVPNGSRNGITGSPVTVVTAANGPVDIISGPDGALYYVAINNGEVRRLSPAGCM